MKLLSNKFFKPFSNKSMAIALFFWISATPVFSATIHVNITNGTVNQSAKNLDYVKILKIAKSMEEVSFLEKPGAKVQFHDIDFSGGASYMVQAMYQGVKYNKFIATTKKETVKIKIKVYDVTNKLTSKVKIMKLYQISYFEKFLWVETWWIIDNKTKKTYSDIGDTTGISIFLPKNAKEASAMVSIDDPNAKIQWLPVLPVPIPGKTDHYLIKQPIKPGNRMYQVRYFIPYEGQKTALPIVNVYPHSQNPMLMVNPPDLKLSIPEKPSWDTTIKFDKKLKEHVVKLPKDSNTYHLEFSGGTPMPPPEGVNIDMTTPATRELKSPLTTRDKLFAGIIFLALAVIMFEYIKSNPVWLQVVQAKSLSRMEFELENIKKYPIKESKKTKQIAKLKSKINFLNKKIT